MGVYLTLFFGGIRREVGVRRKKMQSRGIRQLIFNDNFYVKMNFNNPNAEILNILLSVPIKQQYLL